MSIIPHSYSHGGDGSNPMDDVESRLQASEAEREQTKKAVLTGDLIAANAPEAVEHRKDRLLADPGAANVIPVEHRDALAAGPVTDAPIEAQRSFERQIGGKDTQPCWFITRAAAIRRTVGRIHIRDSFRRTGWATGFLAAPNLLLTNRHVLDSIDTARYSRVEFDYEETFEGDLLSTAVFDLDPTTVFVHHPKDGRDYALVAVSPRARPDCQCPNAELADFGANRLIVDDGKLLKGEPINIVHHPQGQPRQVSLRENRLTAQDSPELHGTWIHYETDTDQGSSGAPLFNDQWEVVGVHHAGVEKRDVDGRILAIGGGVWSAELGERQKLWAANEGLRISRFLQDVAAQLSSHTDATTPEVPERVITPEGAKLVEAMLARAM